MTPELALDLIKFQPLNDKACQSTASQVDLDIASQAALSITRNHIQPIADFFSNRLNGATLSVSNNTLKFHFNDQNEVSETFKMAVLQVVDEPRAKAAALSTMNLLLYDMKYPSAFTDEDDHIMATLMVAHAIDGYRRSIAHEFLHMAQERIGQRRRKQIGIGAAILAAAIIFLWLRLS